MFNGYFLLGWVRFRQNSDGCFPLVLKNFSLPVDGFYANCAAGLA